MSEHRPTPTPVPVTVVGGYLGAGKTTLLNHVLAAAQERVAVLVNDFGDINIDAELITGRDGDTIELANGCICCSLVDGFASALATVKALSPGPDRLVVEASGVADPATVAAYAQTPGLTLDAVVVVVDTETIEDRATDRYVGDTVRAQLQAADIIVVNKVDLVSGPDVDRVTAWLGALQPEGIVIEAERAAVPIELLFGIVPRPDHEPARSSTAAHAEFATWTWHPPHPLSPTAIERAMDEVPAGVWRLKGVVHLDGVDGRHVLQRVGRRWSLEPLDGEPDRSGRSVIVAVGAPGALDDGRFASLFGPG